MKNKKLKHSLMSWIFYSILCYIIIIPFEMWIIGISISLLFGLFLSGINEMITQLRKLNGENFPNIENERSNENK